MSQFKPTFSIADLTADEGVAIHYDGSRTMFGRMLAGLGDMNGDGVSDIALGVSEGGDNWAYGTQYVVYGGSALKGEAELSLQRDGTDGFEAAGSWGAGIGWSASGAGDVNGDGLNDLAFTGSQSQTYVIFGHSGAGPSTVSPAALNGEDGFSLKGGLWDVSSAGDYNGDGIDDLLIGGSNVAYVLYGHTTPFSASIDLTQLSSDQGFAIAGDSHGVLGKSVAGVGDVNGDGFADILVGASMNMTSDPGRAYLLLGSAGGGISKEVTMYVATSPQPSYYSDRVGDSVSAAGDINADGYADFIVGDQGRAGGKAIENTVGHAYVVFGGKSAFDATTLDLTKLDGTNGFMISGPVSGDSFGGAVSSAGDVNGDGYDDLIFGAGYQRAIGGYAAGAVYVVFGKSSGFEPSFDLTTLNGDNGFQITGVDGEGFGGAVSAAGDLDGDGLADLLVGAPLAEGSTGRTWSGAAYIIWGQAPEDAVRRVGTAIGQHLVGGDGKDQLLGVGGDDSLIGGAAKDKLSGGAGKDVLIGGEGPDVLSGGAGKDVFVFKSVTDSPSGAPDTITDLSNSQDRISLSGIDANALLAGDQAFHHVDAFTGHAGDLVVNYHTDDQNAGYTTVKGDVDGDKVADFTLLIAGDHHDFSRFDL